jgi:hypothetical protein
MSTPNVEVLGTQVTATGAVAVHVPGVDVLAFTGTGPGTLPLAIMGLLTLVVGFSATVFGRRRHRGGPAESTGPLRDLSHLASGALR